MVNHGAGPLAWRTSRRSQSTNACVEVAFARDLVMVRDSKDRTGPVITFERDQFAAFLHETINELSSDNGAAELTTGDLRVTYDCGQSTELTHWHLRALGTDAVLHFRHDEWTAFQAGARNGEFDDTAILTPAS
jgi:hypothetical protein